MKMKTDISMFIRLLSLKDISHGSNIMIHIRFLSQLFMFTYVTL